MAITPQQARQELAKRELARRQSASGTTGDSANTPPTAMQRVGVWGGKPITEGIFSKANKGNLDIPAGVPGSQLGKAIGSSLYDFYSAGKQALGGNFKGAWNTLTTPDKSVSPEAVVGDVVRSVALPASLAAAPATIPGIVGAGAGFGAVQAGGNAMVNKESPGQVAGAATKGGIVGGVTAGLIAGAAKLVGSIGQGIVFQNVKPNAADFKDGLPQTSEGFSKLLTKYNIDGSLPTMLGKTQSNLSDLTTELKSTLSDPEATPIDLTSIYDKTVQDVTTGANKLKGFGSNTKVQGALEQLQNEVLEVNPSGKMNIPDAQLVKQAAGGVGSWQYGKIDPEATAIETVYSKFYTNLKTAIEEATPGEAQAINKKIQDLIPLQNALLRRIPVAQRASAFSLGDMVGFMASAANPHLLPIEMANLASKSAWFGNLIKGASAPVAPAIGGMVAGATSQPATTLPTTK